MKILLRCLKWLSLSLLALIVSLLLCWWLIPDQKLDPGAQALLAAPTLPPAEQNAYFLLWGMKASPELDAHAVGQQIVAEHEKLLAAGKVESLDPDKFYGAHPVKLKPARDRCDFERQQCLTAYQNAERQIRADFASNALYIERYRSLRTYPQYAERALNMTATSRLPDYATTVNLSGLLDAWIALQVASPATRKAALDELVAETAVWKRLLHDSDSLISQMICVTILHHKYRLASEIMSAYPDTARQYSAQMTQITAPLSDKEIDFPRALASEFRFSASIFQDLRHALETTSAVTTGDKIGKFLARLGAYRANASINQRYATHQKISALYADNPQQLLAAPSAARANPDPVNWWNPATYFYNPVGNLLASIGDPDFSQYAFRLHDLRAYTRMVELQRRIAEASIAPDHIPAALNNVGANLTNPYTGQPFDYDTAAQTLSFAGHGEKYLSKGRMQVELGKR